MRVAFDARDRARPRSSYARVLDLLLGAATAAGLEAEEWTGGSCDAPVLWSPRLDPPPVQGPRLVLTLHDVNPLLPDDRPFFFRLRRDVLFRRRVRGAAARAWRLATDSHDARRRIREHFPPLGERLRVVPLYPAACFTPGPPDPAVLARLGLAPGYTLFLGALRRHKNWARLVRAWGRLPQALRRAHPLVLAGDAHRARRPLRRLLRETLLETEVRVLGGVPGEALPDLYRGAALFVFPSLLEGFGLPPLEAMAAGVPVAAARATALPEVLGEAAAWFDPRDEAAMARVVEEVLADAGLRERLREAGRRRAREWTAARTGAALQGVLAEAASAVP